MQNVHDINISMSNGTDIKLETGKLARQADGSVMLTCGKTMILATVVANQEAGENVDFLPLTVEYKEKFSASGKFPGGFLKRETRPSEHEILIARLVDRAIRPLFPDDFHANMVVSITLYSADENVNPDAFACLAASAAISVSDIPFGGPVSEVRVGRVNGEMKINPTVEELENSDVDMIIAGTLDNIMMVEGEMQEISEEEMVEVIQFAHVAIKEQCKAQTSLAESASASEKRTYDHEKQDEAINEQVKAFVFDKCKEIAARGIADKHERSNLFGQVKEDLLAHLGEETVDGNEFMIGQYFNKAKKAGVRSAMLENNIRLDGRKTTEVRPIWSEVNYLPGAHGSAVFTRGETQSLSTVTLGSKLDTQMVDGAVFKGNQEFYLHYNFPSFSTGEARPPRSTSRREIGHGNLAQRALKTMVPKDCPYTIRIISDILESNGSSSMATVCAGSLALFDAGIKMKKQVSGIAMGLISENADKYIILSDILGDEDHLGDMDFKVTGTEDGITACQMDIKVDGLSYEILLQALKQAKEGRLHILNEINKTLDAPRADLKDHAPRIVTMVVDKEFMGAIIGPGGKVVQELQAETETTIVLEEVGKECHIELLGNNKEGMDKALATIKGIVAVPEIGETYEATVKLIMPYGAFVEFMPGKQGLLHISEISWKRIETMDGVFKEGDKVKVKLVDIDKQGRSKLSRKVLLERPERTKSKKLN